MAPSDSDLYRKYAEELTRFATGLVGPMAANDVVSSAVLGCVASKHWAQVVNHRAYLFRSVVNEAAKHHRSTGRRLVGEARAISERSVDGPEVRPEILAAVKGLSFRQRTVVVLTYWADLDPRGIAQLLDISESSVRRHLTRAKAHLKETLDGTE
jgi:RNA polymerase sigma factor (sigma-70 family)